MKGNPTGRVGDSAEVGDACEFLCSAKISFIVGRNLLPDGGAFDSSTVRCICGRSVVGGSPAAKPPTAARTYRRESRLRSADATRPRYPPWPKIAMIALAALPWSSVASKPDADVVASGCIAPPPRTGAAGGRTHWLACRRHPRIAAGPTGCRHPCHCADGRRHLLAAVGERHPIVPRIRVVPHVNDVAVILGHIQMMRERIDIERVRADLGRQRRHQLHRVEVDHIDRVPRARQPP